MHRNFHKTQVKLFPYFLGIPFDSLLTSWVANYAHNRDLLKLHALKSYLKAHSSMNFVSKRYLLDFSFVCLGFLLHLLTP